MPARSRSAIRRSGSAAVCRWHIRPPSTDGVFACVADRMADALSEAKPVYSYVFNDATAPAPEPLREAPFPVGAGHSLELRYLFDVGGRRH